MAKLPITVCIIARDEEKHIEECLKHLRKYDWEIIVADTGSIDHTREIAARYADKVVDFAWVDDFAAARNYCASFASNNWILVIDCDEYITSVDTSVLRMLLQKFPRHAGMLRITNMVPKDGEESGYVMDDVPRLYNKNYYHYLFPIHEQVRFIDPARIEDAMDVFMLPIEVVHYGYTLTGEDMARKQRRNLDLLYKALESDPDNAYYHFQVGQSQYVLGDIDAAIRAYEKSMRLTNDMENLYVPELIMSLARAYCQKDRLPEALELLEKYNKIYNTAKFTYEYADLLRENNQVIKALMLYVKVTAMRDMDTLGERQLSCYAHIIDIYRKMGNVEMAELFHQKFQQCLSERERIINS